MLARLFFLSAVLLDAICALKTRVLRSGAAIDNLIIGRNHAMLHQMISRMELEDNREKQHFRGAGFDSHDANSSACKPLVQVLGLFNSGTNFLEQILRTNFPHICSVGDTWKHTNLAVANANMTALSSRGGIVLAMVRDPLSWLQSMRKAPYNLVRCLGKANDGWGPCTSCMGLSGWPEECVDTNWLNKSCTCTVDQDLCHFGLGVEATFKDLPSIWTNWTQSYEKLPQFGVQRSLVIRYESLVLDPQKIVREIAALAGLESPKVIRVPEASTKATGGSHGRTAAIQKLQTKSYLRRYQAGELEKACHLLNLATLQRHDYKDCEAFRGC